MNGTEMYTIFDLPIAVTNSIPDDVLRLSCDSLNNRIIDQAALNASANSFIRIPGTPIETSGKGSGLGATKPKASEQDGVGAAGTITGNTALHTIWIGLFGLFLL
jgi:hypothetical protein